MKLSVQSAINRIAERTSDRTRESEQTRNQRRNSFVDFYGYEFTRQGDANTPATFYISISADKLFLERFEFKLIFTPFSMSVGNGGATNTVSLTNSNTSLTTNGTTISPNPHTHTISPNPHNHTLSSGVTLFTSNPQNVTVWIEDINITAELRAQYAGNWINGEGVYPNTSLDNYDLLKVADSFTDWRQQVLVSSGLKKIEIRSDGIFNVSLLNYLKYSNTNR